MQMVIQILPILLTFSLLLFFKRPPIQAAFVGCLSAIILWLLRFGNAVTSETQLSMASDTWVLFLSTASVIAPGLAFVILIERLGANKDLATWLDSLGWSKAQQVIFIVLGLSPLLESMTGFGVSLIATVPLLMALFPRLTALRIALTGMAIMPWGTLGLATIIGASLAGTSANLLGESSALISMPIFLVLPAIALWVANIRYVKAWLLLGICWVLFMVVLFTVNHFIGPEIAGVLSGLTVLLLGLSLVYKKVLTVKAPYSAVPYLNLLLTIIIIKAILLVTHLNEMWVITGDKIHWQPLASPGLALSFVVLVMLRNKKLCDTPQSLWGVWMARSYKPLLTILFFLTMSQVLLKGGFLTHFQYGLSTLPTALLPPVVATLATLSGYITGSNVGGNAIFMPTIAHLPNIQSSWLTAMQNSGAGHGALGSLSILVLISGLAKAEPIEEQQLVRYGISLACLNAFLITLSGFLLISI